jgi:hypothetical protein
VKFEVPWTVSVCTNYIISKVKKKFPISFYRLISYSLLGIIITYLEVINYSSVFVRNPAFIRASLNPFNSPIVCGSKGGRGGPKSILLLNKKGKFLAALLLPYSPIKVLSGFVAAFGADFGAAFTFGVSCFFAVDLSEDFIHHRQQFHPSSCLHLHLVVTVDHPMVTL